MILRVKLFTVLLLTVTVASCQNKPDYQVYAVKFYGARRIAAPQMVVGANPSDSLSVCYMLWYLKGKNGRNILVDAGMTDTAMAGNKDFVRPDLVLQRINVHPDDITDVIITHPHNDHIGGINLFPRATVWMQKNDFEYFTGGAWQENGFSRGFQKNDVRNLIEINLAGRLKLVDGDNIEIIPGIKVFTGSKHTYENQYLLVNSNSATDRILVASDAIWFYYNLDNLLPATLCMDPVAYVDAMRRMKTLVTDQDLIIPGHDDLVFSKFPDVAEWIVKISK